MFEAKAANTAKYGLPRGKAFFANLHRWSEHAEGKHRIVNALLANRAFRWLAEKWYGIARKRRLPRFAAKEFLTIAAERGWTQRPTGDGPKIAFFADTYARFFDPGLSVHSVEVLQHLGVKVFVPPEQRGSGMAAIQYGDAESARAQLRMNLDAFADLFREGFDVVTAESTAAMVFRQEALNLLEPADAGEAATRTYEFTEYLGRLHSQGMLKAADKPLRIGKIGYHEPCHQRALGSDAATPLRHVLGSSFEPIDMGCSGMGGTWGMTAGGYEPSLRAGKPVFDRFAQNDIRAGVTQCSSCKLQIEQATGKRLLHPAHWLAIAYGLTDDPGALLRAPSTGLVE
jgi:Fe-S oxidoreductase